MHFVATSRIDKILDTSGTLALQVLLGCRIDDGPFHPHPCVALGVHSPSAAPFCGAA